MKKAPFLGFFRVLSVPTNIYRQLASINSRGFNFETLLIYSVASHDLQCSVAATTYCVNVSLSLLRVWFDEVADISSATAAGSYYGRCCHVKLPHCREKHSNQASLQNHSFRSIDSFAGVFPVSFIFSAFSFKDKSDNFISSAHVFAANSATHFRFSSAAIVVIMSVPHHSTSPRLHRPLAPPPFSWRQLSFPDNTMSI